MMLPKMGSPSKLVLFHFSAGFSMGEKIEQVRFFRKFIKYLIATANDKLQLGMQHNFRGLVLLAVASVSAAKRTLASFLVKTDLFVCEVKSNKEQIWRQEK